MNIGKEWTKRNNDLHATYQLKIEYNPLLFGFGFDDILRRVLFHIECKSSIKP